MTKPYRTNGRTSPRSRPSTATSPSWSWFPRPGARPGTTGGSRRPFSRAPAGLTDCWDRLVDQVRANHYRKAGFIREFEKVATGVTPEPEPSFLEKARARWAPPG